MDDDDGVHASVARGLRRAGFVAFKAVSGEIGLGRVESEAIGVVVLDIGLPGLSGTDVVPALRERAETATLPIILGRLVARDPDGTEVAHLNGPLCSAPVWNFSPEPIPST